MAVATMDVEYLSGYLDLPQTNLTTVLDAPTANLVQEILNAVANKAREHDDLAADKLRLEIELDNAARGSATRIEGIKSSLEKAQKTVEELRTRLSEEGKTNTNISRFHIHSVTRNCALNS